MARREITLIKKIVVGAPTGRIAQAAAGNSATLDGESAGYFTNFENLENVPNIFDSGEIASIIAATVDSSYVGIRIDDQILRFVNKDHIDGLGIDAATLDGESASYYLDYNNLVNLPAGQDPSNTDSLPEGLTNLYYTRSRIDSDFQSIFPSMRDSDGTIILSGNIIPDQDAQYSIGSVTNKIRDIYVSDGTIYLGTVALSANDSSGSLIVSVIDENGDIVQTKGQVALIDSDQVQEIIDSAYINARVNLQDTIQSTDELTEGDSNLYYRDARVRAFVDSAYIAARTPDAGVDSATVKGIVDSAYINQRVEGGIIGTVPDGDVNDGAYTGFSSAMTVAEAIDHLNEAMNNVRNDTFVRTVSFTGSPTSGGAGTSVTLNLNVDGNPNRYDVYWGDGTVDSATTDATPSHTYTSNSGSPYTVTVRAFNNGGYGSGMEASSTREDYIVIYTANPSVAFRMFRNSTGGSQILNNDRYVIEGNSLFMENTTTNTLSGTATYTMNWGDGSSNDAIDSDGAAGGVSGDRLEHTWADGTASGSSMDTLTLTLDSHGTADPASYPTSGTFSLKVYDPDISTPDDITSKSISNVSGTSVQLSSGVTNNTSSSTVNPGNTIQRYTTGTYNSTGLSTFAYNNKSGHLVAFINDDSDGGIDLSTPVTGRDTGALDIQDSSDFNLLSSSGSSITFSNSIYHPGLYSGYKARITKAVTSLPVGVNNAFLRHEGIGKTNTLKLLRDDLTAVPTIDSAGILSETTQGTLKYVSGIPHYTNNSVLTVSNAAVSSFVANGYQNHSDVVSITSGTNLENTSGASISTQNYGYSDVDNSDSAMLSSGIPIKGTGFGTAYNIDDLTINVNQSNRQVVENIRMRARNVNGYGSYVNLDKPIQVYSASVTGIDETSISVGAIGGTYSDNGKRIFDLSSADSDNPAFSGSTNFYTNSVYSTSADPGVSGTQEASVRFGTLQHLTTDYSSYLPVGPDRSGDTGDQYFTFAFRRTALANFNINITASSGISGLYIAAPGTTTDTSSTINGWLDASVAYAGAGIPGAGTGGNGSNGCGSGSLVPVDGTAINNGTYTVTLGTENLTNATGNVALVRVVLQSGQSVTSLSIS